MLDYDFQILQYNEFECLTRDLLQKKEGVFVESFTPGKDGGIDLRFAKVRGQNTIVQVKRYKDTSLLKRELLKEVPKVKALNPDRYIISTSAGLSPEAKESIKKMFAPYIQATEDILGKDDLNNLLGQYPEVEKQYYKLWLGSTTVLEDILNKRINNWSAIEMEKIRRDVSTYVMNDSFDDALKILKENRYVVISGIPGIGKTTLARMLVNYLLSEGYEEFVMLEGIGDAAQKLTEGKKQIFFFDDFLGSTYFQNDEKGFDHKLVAFIDKVQHESDKIFILSTREYILAEAKQKFDVLTTQNIELAKCILDLSSYTEGIRAKILYNHLAMAELPLPYVRALLQRKQYMRIIQHDNFNPRIIETFLNSKLYLQVEPKDFVAQFRDFFDNPLAVWEMTFKQLKPITQYALIVRMSMGSGPVLLSEWYEATKKFVKGTQPELNLNLNEVVWNETLKIIEGSFILTTHDKNDYVVKYMNPSVFDFLVAWLKTYREIQGLIIRESYFEEQIYTPFSSDGYPSFMGYGRIELHESLYPTLEKAYKRHLKEQHTCSLYDYGRVALKKNTDIVEFLLMMDRSYGKWFKKRPDLLSDVVTQEMLENKDFMLGKRMSLLEKLTEDTKRNLDLVHLTGTVIDESDSLDDFVNSLDLLNSTATGKAALTSDSFHERVEAALNDELEKAETTRECERISDCLSELVKNVPKLDEGVWEEAISEAMSKIPEGPEFSDDFSREFNTGDTVEKDEYEEMFTSLLERVEE